METKSNFKYSKDDINAAGGNAYCLAGLGETLE